MVETTFGICSVRPTYEHIALTPQTYAYCIHIYSCCIRTSNIHSPMANWIKTRAGNFQPRNVLLNSLNLTLTWTINFIYYYSDNGHEHIKMWISSQIHNDYSNTIITYSKKRAQQSNHGITEVKLDQKTTTIACVKCKTLQCMLKSNVHISEFNFQSISTARQGKMGEGDQGTKTKDMRWLLFFAPSCKKDRRHRSGRR